jgi:regulator of nucleoside diphosphate kinase
MTSRTILINEFDHRRLQGLIERARTNDPMNQENLAALAAELDRATIVPQHETGPDVITMNSTAVLVDVEDGEEEEWTLVFPEDADIDRNRISVLAPIGIAMLGYRVGDTFEWTTPGGVRKLRVKSILYQPESSGDFNR